MPQAEEVQNVPLALRTVPSAGDQDTASGHAATVVDEARGPAVLTVRRTASDDVQDRQVYLSVDGEDWVSLLYGHEVSMELAPGRHTLKANNTLVRKSVTFDVRPGQHVRFQCINRTHWTGMVFMAFLGAAVITVRLERESTDD